MRHCTELSIQTFSDCISQQHGAVSARIFGLIYKAVAIASKSFSEVPDTAEVAPMLTVTRIVESFTIMGFASIA